MRASRALWAARKPSFSLWGEPEREVGKRGIKVPNPAHKKPLLKREGTAEKFKPKNHFAGDYIPIPQERQLLLGPSHSNSVPIGVDETLIPIIFEDKHYAFVAKPAGQAVHESTEFGQRVRMHAVAKSWTYGKLMFKLSPGASGVVLFSKHAYGKTQVGSKRLRERRRLSKTTPISRRIKGARPHELGNFLRMEYVALVHGIPDTPSDGIAVLRASIVKQAKGYVQLEPTRVLPDLVCRLTVLASVPHKTMGHISAISFTVHCALILLFSFFSSLFSLLFFLFSFFSSLFLFSFFSSLFFSPLFFSPLPSLFSLSSLSLSPSLSSLLSLSSRLLLCFGFY